MRFFLAFGAFLEAKSIVTCSTFKNFRAAPFYKVKSYFRRAVGATLLELTLLIRDFPLENVVLSGTGEGPGGWAPGPVAVAGVGRGGAWPGSARRLGVGT